MSNEFTELPETWGIASVSEVCLVMSGQTPKEIESFALENGEIPWFRVGNMNDPGNEEFLVKSDVHLNSEGIKKLKLHIYPKGTIVFPKRGGAIATNKKRILAQPSAYDLNVMGIFPIGLDNRFFWHWFQSVDLKQLSDGSNVPQINHGDIEPLTFPLPPLNEQKRIVAKIEELRDRHQRAKQALETIPELCDRFRQSVLAAAFRGDLTADWREQNPDVEPASVLLERIRGDRQKCWEKAEDGKRKSKYKEEIQISLESLPELPVEWEWVSFDLLIVDGPQNGLYLPQTKYGTGVPILRIDNFQDNWSNSSGELRLVNASKNDIELYSLQENDIVINRVNSPSHLGKALLVEARNLPSLFESNMMRLKMAEVICTQYIDLYLRSPLGKTSLTKHAKWAVNQASINQTDVKSAAIPLPPLQEQFIIVKAVKNLLSFSRSTLESVQSSQDFLKILDQSILAQAFRGELVEQDPNDEPAFVLLDRIRAEREKASKSTKGRGRGSKASKGASEQMTLPDAE